MTQHIFLYRRRIPCQAGKLYKFKSLEAFSLTSDFFLVTLAQGEYVSSPEARHLYVRMAVYAASTAGL